MLTLTKIRRFLNDCKFGKDDPAVRTIIEMNSSAYCYMKVTELLKERMYRPDKSTVVKCIRLLVVGWFIGEADKT